MNKKEFKNLLAHLPTLFGLAIGGVFIMSAGDGTLINILVFIGSALVGGLISKWVKARIK